MSFRVLPLLSAIGIHQAKTLFRSRLRCGVFRRAGGAGGHGVGQIGVMPVLHVEESQKSQSTMTCHRRLALDREDALRRVPVACPPRSPRPYQKRVVDYFFQNAGQAAEQRRPLRFQMACSTGKTFTYGMIIAQDHQTHPDARYVVFVPWRDLGKQTKRELEAFKLSVCLIGDGQSDIDPAAIVVVCVYASAHYLRGLQFRIKIVDEAHHLESPVLRGYTDCIRRDVFGTMAVDFSATFHQSSCIDFSYDFDQAVREGYVCDFDVTVALLSGGDRTAAIARHVAKCCNEWAPMFVLFNRKDRATLCVEHLAKCGVSARFVDGTASTAMRRAAIEDLTSGTLKAICLVALFNEGISIDELRTVVFADTRHSRVNLQQVAMRVTRLHASKRLGHVVLALDEESVAGDEEVRDRVRDLSRISPEFEKRLREQDKDWFRVEVVDVDATRSQDCARVLMAMMCDRFGKYLSEGPEEGRTAVFELKLDGLLTWMRQHGGSLPDLRSKDMEERTFARWVNRLRRKHQQAQLDENTLRILKSVDGLVEIVTAPSTARFKWYERFRQLQSWVEKHCGVLPRRSSTDPDERCLGRWLHSFAQLYRAGKIDNVRLKELQRIPGMTQRLAQWEAARPQDRSWDDVISCLQSFFSRHPGAWPAYDAKDHDEKTLARWLRRIRLKLRKGKLSDEQLLRLTNVPGLAGRLAQWKVESPHSRQRGWDGFTWEQWCARLRTWAQSHAGTLPPDDSGGGEEKLLARWLNTVRHKYRRGKLDDEQLTLLLQAPGMFGVLSGWHTAGTQHLNWPMWCSQLQQWLDQHIGVLPSRSAADPEEKIAAGKLEVLRCNYRFHRLPETLLGHLQQHAILMEAVMQEIQPRAWKQTWEERCCTLHQWVEMHSGALPKQTSQDPVEKSLASFLQAAQKKHRDRILSVEALGKLEEIPGMSKRLSQWKRPALQLDDDSYYVRLCSWSAQHEGRLPGHDKEAGAEETQLAGWLSRKQQQYRKATLSDELMSKLQQLPGMLERLERTKTPFDVDKFARDLECWECETTGRLPRRTAHDSRERHLADRLHQVQKNGGLSDVQLIGLRRISGMTARMARWEQASDWNQ